MIIAVISDVHGNLPALEAALTEARKRGADPVIGAGDWVGYGPFPGEVIDRLQQLEHFVGVRGNYDVKAIDAIDTPSRYSGRLKSHKWTILNWTRKQLHASHVQWLKSLPDFREMRPLPDCRIHVVHGSPESIEGRVYPSITRNALHAMIRNASYTMTQNPLPTILITGHTHIPFVTTIDGCLIMNPGSTGQPVDRDPDPTFGLLTVEPDHPPHGVIIRFTYPRNIVIDAIHQNGLPDWLADDFETGKKRP